MWLDSATDSCWWRDDIRIKRSNGIIWRNVGCRCLQALSMWCFNHHAGILLVRRVSNFGHICKKYAQGKVHIIPIERSCFLLSDSEKFLVESYPSYICSQVERCRTLIVTNWARTCWSLKLPLKSKQFVETAKSVDACVKLKSVETQNTHANRQKVRLSPANTVH